MVIAYTSTMRHISILVPKQVVAEGSIPTESTALFRKVTSRPITTSPTVDMGWSSTASSLCTCTCASCAEIHQNSLQQMWQGTATTAN